jgi:hypothetical protein
VLKLLIRFGIHSLIYRKNTTRITIDDMKRNEAEEVLRAEVSGKGDYWFVRASCPCAQNKHTRQSVSQSVGTILLIPETQPTIHEKPKVTSNPVMEQESFPIRLITAGAGYTNTSPHTFSCYFGAGCGVVNCTVELVSREGGLTDQSERTSLTVLQEPTDMDVHGSERVTLLVFRGIMK